MADLVIDEDRNSRGQYECYGCVKCQDWHFDDEPVFHQHLKFISKHGRAVVSEEVRWYNTRHLIEQR